MKSDTRGLRVWAVLMAVLVCLAVQAVFTLPAYGSEIVGWGYNDYGQATPPAGNDFIAIAAGTYHSLALKSDGSIVGWGSNYDWLGDIYYGQATPPSGNDFIAIAAGWFHSLALKSDGSIVGWGSNLDGWGNWAGQATPPAGSNFTAIAAAGEAHSLALRQENNPPAVDAGEDQTVYAWIDGFADATLNGSDSNDPDGDTLTYTWAWTIGGEICEATGVSPTIQLPIGVHTIQLVVNDGLVDSAPDEVNVTVIAPVKGTLNITPRTINRKSNQPSIHALIKLPDTIGRDDVNTNEPIVFYPGGIEATRQWIVPSGEGGAKLDGIFGFFDKAALMDVVPTDGNIELKVAGKLKSGQYFYGSDTVRIIH